MAPLLIEPLSEQAYELLRQLEALHVLRVVPAAPEAAAPASARPSVASLIGSLSPEAAERMLKETTAMRSEWEREY